MSKNKLETDDFRTDDELEFDDFNFDMEQTAPKDDRTPATKVKDSVIEGMKERVVDPSFIEGTIKSALPKQYGEAYDMADKVLTSAKDEITKGLKTVQPAAKSFFTSAKKAVPKDHFLHDKLESIENWLGEYDEYKSEKADTKKIREDSINLAIGEIFKTQIEQSEKQNAAENLDRGIETQRYKNTTKISSSIEKGISSLVQYQNTINVNYQRKSLELQLRSYFLQTDMLEHMRKAHIESIAEFKLISKNTALPEYVKTTQHESFKEMARNKLMESVTGGLFKSSNDMIEGFMKNISNAIKQKASSAANAFSMGAMGLDTINSMNESGMDMNFDGEPKQEESFNQKILNMLGKMGGGSIIDFLAGKAGSMTRSVLDKNKTVGRYSRELGMVMEDMPARVQEFKTSNQGEYGYDSGLIKNFLSSVVRGFKSLIPGAQADMGLATTAISDLNKPSYTPDQTNKSINEIIPGYLARILKEVKIFRTGDESIGLLQYDFHSNSFSKEKDIVAKIKESILPESAKKDADYKLDRLVKMIDKDNTLSDDDKNVLKKTLFTSSAKLETSKVERFKDKSVYERAGATPEQTEKLMKLFAEQYATTDDILADKDREANFSNAFVGLRDSIKDTRKNAQQYINLGQLELLKKSGLTKTDSSGNISIDYEKLIEEYVKPTTPTVVTSDYYKKQNIRPVSGNDSLRMVNSMPITKWDYKQGFGGNAKDVAGPMAQAVNTATDGQASDGKSVNLTALNGYNMGAIQELDKRQRTILDFLSAAKDNIKSFFTPKEKEDPLLKTLEESRDIQKQILEKLSTANITVGGGGGFDLSGLMRRPQGIAENIAALITSMGSLVGSGVSAAATGVGKAAGLAAKGARSFKGWWDAPSPAMDKIKGKIGEKIDSAYNKFKQYGDVFVAGEKNPRILFNKLKEGKYYKMLENGSRVAISKVEDITDDIYDELGNLVLKKDEIKNTFSNMVESGKSRTMKLLSIVGGKISQGTGYIKGLIPPAFRSIKSLFDKVTNKAKEIMDYPADVYVKGETTPRLTAFVMKNGGYFSNQSKKPINRPSLIDGPVCDIEGNILITAEDIQKGLVDKFGNDFTFPLLRLAKTGFAIGKKLATASLKLGKNLLDKGLNKLKSINLPNINFGFGFDLMGQSSKQSVELLTEIRDMIKIKWGFEYEFMGPRKPLAEVKSTTSDKEESNTENTAAAAASTSNKTNTIDSVVSGVGSMIGKGKGLLSKIPKIGGLFTDNKQETVDNLKEDAEKVKDSAKEKIKEAQDAAKEAAKSAKEKIQEVTESSKEAIEQAKAKASQTGEKVKKAFNDTDGDGKRQGSWRDKIMGNKKNKEFDKAKAELPQYENTFDVIGKKLSGIKDTIGSIVGGVGSLVGSKGKMGKLAALAGVAAGAAGIDTGQAGGGITDTITDAADLASTARGAGTATTVAQGAGTAATTAAEGAAAAGAAKKPGLLRRGFGLLGRGAKAVYNSPIGKGLKWAAGKGSFGMLKGAARMVPMALRGIGTVGGLALRGGLMLGGGVLGAAGAAAGGILGTALAGTAALMASPIVMGATAAYATYKIFKYLTRNSISDLGLYRYVQYGFDAEDNQYVSKILGLESYLEENALVFGKGGDANLTKLKPDMVKEVFSLFDIDTDNQEQIEKFQTWFQYRFKPIFLQHQSAVFKVDKEYKLSTVDDLKNDKKLQYFKSVKMENGPYDIVVSPFPDMEALPSGASEVAAYYGKQLPKLEEKKDEGYSLKEMITNPWRTIKDGYKGLVDIKNKAMQKLSDGYNAAKDWASEKLNSAKDWVSGKLSGVKDWFGEKVNEAKKLVSQTSNAVGKAFGNNISNLDSIRFRMYGLMDMDRLKVIALRNMEEKLFKFVKFEGNGAATISMDVKDALDMFKMDFGIASQTDKMAMRWYNWFSNRFLKVYLEYCGSLKAQLGKATIDDFGVKNSQALEIANRLNAVNVWGVKDSPWDNYELNSFATSVEPFINLIRQKVNDDKLIEEKAQKDKEKSKLAKEQVQANKEGKLTDSTKADANRLASPKPSGALPGPDPMYTPKNPTTDEQYKNGPKFAAAGSASGAVGDKSGNAGASSTPTPSGTGDKIDKIPAPQGAGYKAVEPTIREAAKATGVKEDTMLAVAAVESGFRPDAVPKGKGMKSSAKGLFQFVDSTWEEIVRQKGRKYDIPVGASPFDARANSLMGGEYIKQNTNYMKSVVPEVGPTEAYMAHFLGPGGAKQFFSMSKDEPAAVKMPKAAAANTPIFYGSGGRPKSVGEIYSEMAGKLKGVTRAYGLDVNINTEFKGKSSGSSTGSSAPMASGGAAYGSNKTSNLAPTGAPGVSPTATPATSGASITSAGKEPTMKSGGAAYGANKSSNAAPMGTATNAIRIEQPTPKADIYKPKPVETAVAAATPTSTPTPTSSMKDEMKSSGIEDFDLSKSSAMDEMYKTPESINPTSIQTQPIPTQAVMQASAPIPTQVRYQKAPYNNPSYSTQRQTPDVFGIGGMLKSAADAIAPSSRVGAYNTPNAPTYSRPTPGYNNSNNPFTALGALINTAPAQRSYGSSVPMANPTVVGTSYSAAPVAVNPVVTSTPVVNQQPSIVATAKPNLVAKDTSSINVNQDKEYLNNLVSIDSTLTKSLDVQKEILKAILAISNKESSPATKAVETVAETKTSEAAPINRSSKEVPKFPISMSRTTYA